MSTETPIRDEHGFTLLELVTVLGLIAVLSGLGIGFLSRADNAMDVTVAVLRSNTRLAYETARNTGRPTSVELHTRRSDEQEEIGQFLRAKVLSTIGQWHLEPGETPYEDLTAVIRGRYEPEGRFGHCLVLNEENPGTLFSVETGENPRFNVIDGFALKVELYLETRERCVVANMPPTFTLELDDDLRPVARMVLAEPGPQRGPTVELTLPETELPLRRWVTVEILHDGRVFRLLVDGVVIGEKSAKGEPFQQKGALFEVSPEGSPIPGRIDEIQLMGYERAQPADLPTDVEVSGLSQPMEFDRRGNLVRPVTFEIKYGEETRKLSVAPGGVLQ